MRVRTNVDLLDTATKMDILLRKYERHERRFIKKYLSTELDVVELGASIGATGRLITRGSTVARRIVSVEANPGLIAVLEQNLMEEARLARPVVVQRAIDYSGDGHVDLYVGERPQDSSTEAANLRSTGSVSVPSTRLSDILDEFDIESYLLVCDIEGAEYELFRDDVAAFEHCQEIMIEMHGSESRIQELLGEINDLGFILIESANQVYFLKREGLSIGRS